MQVKIKVTQEGKLEQGSKDNLRDLLIQLTTGDYIVSIDRVNPLVTPRDYQKAYFDKVDIAVAATGNDRYTIHEEFKKFSEIESTKALTIPEWKKLLDKFNWWAYDTFDCIV